MPDHFHFFWSELLHNIKGVHKVFIGLIHIVIFWLSLQDILRLWGCHTELQNLNTRAEPAKRGSEGKKHSTKAHSMRWGWFLLKNSQWPFSEGFRTFNTSIGIRSILISNPIPIHHLSNGLCNEVHFTTKQSNQSEKQKLKTKRS